MADFDQRPACPLGRAMSLGGDPKALASYYAEWAPTYDRDVGDSEYGLPNSVLVTIDHAVEQAPELADSSITILDAGCGTGRIGMVLAEHGYTTIDGIDLSDEMVAVASTRGCYRDLESGVDLTLPASPRWKHAARLVIVGGVFTVGHIPPSALHEVAQLVEPGGLLVTTVRPGYYDTTDYREVSEAFVASGAADLLVGFDDLPYTADTNGRFYAYRINEPA